MAEAKLSINVGGDTVKVTVIVGQSLGIHVTPNDIGKLLYIDRKGRVSTLTLGAGLAIRNGVLMLTGQMPDVPDDPEEPVLTEAICGLVICGEAICGGEY